jgi:uncharacterized membrane protein YdjX (TVP38/TMEM64 family)
VGEWIIALASAARESGWIGITLFIVAYVAGTPALLPGSLLTLAAGFAYGPVWGVLLASPASVAGATLAFVLGRTLFRKWAEARLSTVPTMRALDSGLARGGFTLVLLLRLSPLFPFVLMNYALSLTGVRLRTYVLASFIGMLPGTAMYVYLGSLVPTAAALATRRAGDSLSTGLYAAGLVATVAAAVAAARLARRALEAHQSEPNDVGDD